MSRQSPERGKIKINQLPEMSAVKMRTRVSILALTVFTEPTFSNHASVADDADAGEPQVPFAELNQPPQELPSVVQEGLSAGEVDLFHSCHR